jgi:hypothetical protein
VLAEHQREEALAYTRTSSREGTNREWRLGEGGQIRAERGRGISVCFDENSPPLGLTGTNGLLAITSSSSCLECRAPRPVLGWGGLAEGA